LKLYWLYRCALFIHRKPTKENPNPELNLGYSRSIPKKRPPPRNREILPNLKRQKLEDDEQILDIHVTSQEIGIQTDSESSTGFPKEKTRSIGTQVNFSDFSPRKLGEDEMKFYTGLNVTMFLAIAFQFQKSLANTPTDGLAPAEDQFLLILARMKLNLRLKDLAFRFKLNLPVCSKIFSHGIVILSKVLSDAVVWLPKERIQATMPTQFAEIFPDTTCIIDCSEVLSVYSTTNELIGQS